MATDQQCDIDEKGRTIQGLKTAIHLEREKEAKKYNDIVRFKQQEVDEINRTL